MKLTAAEVEHMKRWRAYRAWVDALPPMLRSDGPRAIRNDECSALGTIKQSGDSRATGRTQCQKKKSRSKS